MSTPAVLAATHDLTGHDARLIVAALLGIGVVVLLIALGRVNPFLSLLVGSGVLAGVAGLPAAKAITSFETGAGSTFGSVGILVALGAMVGRLLVDSGGAAQVVDTIVDRVSRRLLPWAMAGAAALIGLPMFFEIGVVLLIPIVLLVSRRSRLPVLQVGIPALAGLSALHGFVPPHPGPLLAITTLHADLGLTLGLGLIVAIPAVILAGPVYGSFIAPYGPAQPPRTAAGSIGDDEEREGALVGASGAGAAGVAGSRRGGRGGGAGGTTDGGTMDGGTVAAGQEAATPRRRPSFGATVATVVLPVVMMLAKAVADLTAGSDNGVRKALDVVGDPVVALLAGVVLAMFTLGVAVGMDRRGLSSSIEAALPPVAGTLLIIAAGGGFKQTLVDAGVGKLIGQLAEGRNLSPLVLGWLVAVGIRLATGSATVATITAAGIVGPLASAEHLDKPTLSLLVLAIGAGSVFFSHVNDVGFWLIKQYFGMTVKETLLSWSVMETIISVVGLAGVLLLHLVV